MFTQKIKLHLQVIDRSKYESVALLILRVVMGVAFCMHGWSKIQSPMNWIPPQAPIHVPGFFQLLAALSEFGGGIALILGLLTPLASAGLLVTMSVATYLHMVILGDPFVNPTGGMSYELALIYWAVSVLFLFMGPGQFSIDAKIFGKRS